MTQKLTTASKLTSAKKIRIYDNKHSGQNAIQEWGCAYKITDISAATGPRLINMVSN